MNEEVEDYERWVGRELCCQGGVRVSQLLSPPLLHPSSLLYPVACPTYLSGALHVLQRIHVCSFSAPLYAFILFPMLNNNITAVCIRIDVFTIYHVTVDRTMHTFFLFWDMINKFWKAVKKSIRLQTASTARYFPTCREPDELIR